MDNYSEFTRFYALAAQRFIDHGRLTEASETKKIVHNCIFMKWHQLFIGVMVTTTSMLLTNCGGVVLNITQEFGPIRD